MKTKQKLLNGIFMGTILCFTASNIGGVNMAHAQETQTGTLDSIENVELARLVEEKKIAEARRDLLKVENEIAAEELTSKKKEIETKLEGLPTPVSKGLEGTITVDSESGYYGRTLAYTSLDQTAAAIKEDLCLRLNPYQKLVVLDGFELAEAIAQWSFVKAELERMEQTISDSTSALSSYSTGTGLLASDGNTETLIGTTGLVLTALPKIVGAVGDIAKLFKTNVSVTTVKLGKMQTALRSAVIGQILSAKGCAINVFDPSLSTSTTNTLSDSLKIISKDASDLATLRDQVLLGLERSRLQNIASQEKNTQFANAIIEIVKLRTDKMPTEEETKDIADAQEDAGKNKAAAGTLAYMKTSITASVKSTLDRLAALETALTEAKTGELPVLQSLIIVDQLLADDNNPYFLSLKVDSAGSEAQISKNTFRSDRLSYYGSVAVTYEVSDLKGRIRAAGLKTHTCTGNAKRSNGFLDFTGAGGTNC